MPLLRYSTAVLLLLDAVDPETNQRVWDQPEVLQRFGITARPSREPDAPIPHGLTRTSSQHIAILIDLVRNIAIWEQKRDTIELKTDCPAGCEAWARWFTSRIAKFLNKYIDKTLWELDIHPSQVIDRDELDTFPSADTAASDNASEIAVSLIGFAAYKRGHPSLRDEIRRVTSCIVRQSHERLKKAWSRAKGAYEERKVAADTAMEDLEKAEKITLKMIRVAIERVNRYKQASLLKSADLERVEVYEASLEALFELVGKSTTERPRKTDLSRDGEKKVKEARKRMSKKPIVEADLANKRDVERTWSLFVSAFVDVEEDDEVPSIPNDGEISRWEEGDLDDRGVGRYKASSVEDLCTLLGFPNSRPPSWSAFRNPDPAFNGWDHKAEFDRVISGDPIASGYLPIHMLWHQLVGVASMIDKTFSKAEAIHVAGIILADAVGIGKTAQIMAFIAFLQLVYTSETDDKVPRPPIVANTPFFMGKEGVPNLPHMVVVPNTLVDQVRREFKVFFSNGSLDIFVWPTDSKVNFFESPQWKNCSHEPIFRVVIVPYSAFQTVSASIFPCKAHGRKGKSVDCKRKVKNARDLPKSFFNCKWSTVFLDEAHELRTANAKFVGAIQLRSLASFVCCVTATPIYQSVLDVIYIGRVVGIPGLMGTDGAELEKKGKRELIKSRQEMSEEDRKKMLEVTQARFISQDVGDMEDPMQEIVESGEKFVTEVKEKIGDQMIRRTAESRKPDGSYINDTLTPLVRYTYPVILSSGAQARLDLELVRCKEKGKTKKKIIFRLMFSTENFYLPYRTLLSWAVPIEHESGDAKLREWPILQSLEELQNYDSPKAFELVELVKKCLADDRFGPIEIQPDFSIVFPELPAVENPQQTRKVLIYHEFPMMADTLVSLFNLHGIYPFVVNGNQSLADRTASINEFIANTDPSRRVLLFSKCGACGLNLACADVVILYDVVWSEVVVTQIIGRSHRYGQLRTVYVYAMVALGTTDVLMSAMAGFKNEMLQKLVSRDPVPDPTTDADQPEEDSEVEDEVVSMEDDGKKRKARRGKKVDDDVDDGEEDEEEEDPPPKKGRGRRSTSKRAKVTAGANDEPDEATEEPNASKPKASRRGRGRGRGRGGRGSITPVDHASPNFRTIRQAPSATGSAASTPPITPSPGPSTPVDSIFLQQQNTASLVRHSPISSNPNSPLVPGKEGSATNSPTVPPSSSTSTDPRIASLLKPITPVVSMSLPPSLSRSSPHLSATSGIGSARNSPTSVPPIKSSLSLGPLVDYMASSSDEDSPGNVDAGKDARALASQSNAPKPSTPLPPDADNSERPVTPPQMSHASPPVSPSRRMEGIEALGMLQSMASTHISEDIPWRTTTNPPTTFSQEIRMTSPPRPPPITIPSIPKLNLPKLVNEDDGGGGGGGGVNDEEEEDQYGGGEYEGGGEGGSDMDEDESGAYGGGGDGGGSDVDMEDDDPWKGPFTQRPKEVRVEEEEEEEEEEEDVPARPSLHPPLPFSTHRRLRRSTSVIESSDSEDDAPPQKRAGSQPVSNLTPLRPNKWSLPFRKEVPFANEKTPPPSPPKKAPGPFDTDSDDGSNLPSITVRKPEGMPSSSFPRQSQGGSSSSSKLASRMKKRTR